MAACVRSCQTKQSSPSTSAHISQQTLAADPTSRLRNSSGNRRSAIYVSYWSQSSIITFTFLIVISFTFTESSSHHCSRLKLLFTVISLLTNLVIVGDGTHYHTYQLFWSACIEKDKKKMQPNLMAMLKCGHKRNWNIQRKIKT